MTSAGWWGRWRRVAHRAAVVQSNVVLTLLYFLTIAPLGFFMGGGRRRPSSPRWTALPLPPEEASRWRAQF